MRFGPESNVWQTYGWRMARVGTTVRLTALATALVLVACAAPGPEEVYRDPAAPISSTTRFDPVRFAGAWQVVARVGAEGAPVRRYRDLGAGRMAVIEGGETRIARLTGPGRFEVDGRKAEVWVLWVDDGFRAAAIGTPSGAFGEILMRPDAVGRADLRRAAGEILEWQGYDMARFREIEE